MGDVPLLLPTLVVLAVAWIEWRTTRLISVLALVASFVLLVRYPSREAFARMVADPAYQEITGIRTRSLDAAVLQATTPWRG